MIMAADRTTPITVTIVRVRLFFHTLQGCFVENIHGRVTVLSSRVTLPSDMQMIRSACRAIFSSCVTSDKRLPVFFLT